jgi:eukaryotic-like serine/threonine-protein kinase
VAQVVGGRYHLIAHLGGGAVADVSLAKADAAAAPAPTLPQLVVVKRLVLGADAEPDVLAQFAEESAVAQRLKHPNIAKAYEAGEGSDGPYLVLEYLEGQTLARLRSRAHRRGQGVPRGIALFIVMQMAAALAYAHDLKDEAGKPLRIVHRDLSPENVVVTYDGATKIFDFTAPPRPGTKPGATAPRGTVAYRAPEQVKSAVALDARVDVFTAGIVLWELLAGRRMWEGLSEAEVLARLADDQPLPTLRSVVPDMPESIDLVCAQALAKIRDDRFDSIGDLRDALAKLTTSPGLSATAAQVAELVTSLFEDEREKMRATVEEALVRPAGAPGSLPQLRPLAPTSSNKFVDVDTDPSLWVKAAPNVAPAVPATTTRVVEVLRVEQAPSPDRRFALAVGGAVLIAFAVVAVVAFTSGSPKPDVATPVATAARPTPTAPSVDPVGSAPPEPEEVTIDITVRPLTAKLTIDGVRTPSNPHHVKVVRGKFVHEVRAEAEGFEPRTMSVQFDRDRTFDIALVPKHPPPPPPPPPPTAKKDAQ